MRLTYFICILLLVFSPWVSMAKPHTAIHDSSHNMMSQCMQMMRDLGPKDAEYDKRFLDMMIMHHEGALDMSQDALQKASHPELKQMAQHIIDAQKREIAQMKTWRNKWYPTKKPS